MIINIDQQMSQTANLRRIQNEVKQIQTEKDYANICEIRMVGDDMYHWEGVIYGPEDTLYFGYKFKLDIKLPSDYPFSAPTIKFVTPIQHVNVSQKGDICLDILKTDWAPSLNMQKVLLTIRVLMSAPNPDDPLNSDLAQLYRTDEKQYSKKIKDCCRKNAILVQKTQLISDVKKCAK